MSDNPSVVTADTTFTWDGVTQRLARGTILDVPPGSALEAAIGRDRLAPITGTAAHGAGPVPAATDDGETGEPADGGDEAQQRSPKTVTAKPATPPAQAAKTADGGGKT